jgi:hypothetical protein
MSLPADHGGLELLNLGPSFYPLGLVERIILVLELRDE